jgi:hypothetical protein
LVRPFQFRQQAVLGGSKKSALGRQQEQAPQQKSDAGLEQTDQKQAHHEQIHGLGPHHHPGFAPPVGQPARREGKEKEGQGEEESGERDQFPGRRLAPPAHDQQRRHRLENVVVEGGEELRGHERPKRARRTVGHGISRGKQPTLV